MFKDFILRRMTQLKGSPYYCKIHECHCYIARELHESKFRWFSIRKKQFVLIINNLFHSCIHSFLFETNKLFNLLHWTSYKCHIIILFIKRFAIIDTNCNQLVSCFLGISNILIVGCFSKLHLFWFKTINN